VVWGRPVSLQTTYTATGRELPPLVAGSAPGGEIFRPGSGIVRPLAGIPAPAPRGGPPEGGNPAPGRIPTPGGGKSSPRGL
jgi:hypothetical protein